MGRSALLLFLCTAVMLSQAYVLSRESMRRPQDSLYSGNSSRKRFSPVRLFPSYPFSYLCGILFTAAAAAFLYRTVRRRAPGRVAFTDLLRSRFTDDCDMDLVPIWNDSDTFGGTAPHCPGGERKRLAIQSSLPGWLKHGNITEAEEALHLAVQEIPIVPMRTTAWDSAF